MRRSSASAPQKRRSMNVPSSASSATPALHPPAMLPNLLATQAPPAMARPYTSITHANGGQCSYSIRRLFHALERC
jgi:hypothetical protein